MDRNFDAMQVIVIVMVALRKESVDRNDAVSANNHKRRVALRKESVDRNVHYVCQFASDGCRSPQGERG